MQSLKKSRFSLIPVTDNGLTTPEAVQHAVMAEGIIGLNRAGSDKVSEERCKLPAFVPSAASVCGLLSNGTPGREAVGIRHLVEGHAYEEAVWI